MRWFSALFPRHRPRCPPRLAWQVLLAALAFGALSGCHRHRHAIDSKNVSFEGQNFRLVNIDLQRHTLSLHWLDPDTHQPYRDIESLRRWASLHGKRLLFAANAGIYDRETRPLGLYVEDGQTLVPLNLAHGRASAGNFSLLPNGVFAIFPDGHAAVQTTVDYKTQGKPARLATQSGPMLVIGGELNPNFIDDSISMKWRSGVCAQTPQLALFVVSETPVNFHTFARLFRDRLHCRDALYLDGSISQFYLDDRGYDGAPVFMVKPYAGIFAVLENP